MADDKLLQTQVQTGGQNTVSAHIQLSVWCKWKKSKKWHLHTSALWFTGCGVALSITCDHFEHSCLCEALVGVKLCRGADNCGEMSARESAFSGWSRPEWWNFLVFTNPWVHLFPVFTSANCGCGIKFVWNQQCSTPSTSTLHPATARLLQQTHVCLIPSEHSQLGLSRCALLYKSHFFSSCHVLHLPVSNETHTQPAPPPPRPPAALGFSFLPRSPPQLRCSLPGLTSICCQGILSGFPLFLLLQVSFASWFCVYNTHPIPVTTPLPHHPHCTPPDMGAKRG